MSCCAGGRYDADAELGAPKPWARPTSAPPAAHAFGRCVSGQAVDTRGVREYATAKAFGEAVQHASKQPPIRTTARVPPPSGRAIAWPSNQKEAVPTGMLCPLCAKKKVRSPPRASSRLLLRALRLRLVRDRSPLTQAPPLVPCPGLQPRRPR